MAQMLVCSRGSSLASVLRTCLASSIPVHTNGWHQKTYSARKAIVARIQIVQHSTGNAEVPLRSEMARIQMDQQSAASTESNSVTTENYKKQQKWLWRSDDVDVRNVETNDVTAMDAVERRIVWHGFCAMECLANAQQSMA